MKKRITILAIALITGVTASAQLNVNEKFGKGLVFYGKDDSYKLKMNTRIQSRYDGIMTVGDVDSYTNAIYLRRARIKFGGYAFSPKVTFKSEFDVVNGFVLDAVVKYNFYKGFTIWAGQTKLAGNRERVISSQQLQFVDRSQLNSKFNIDRDAGVQLHHKFNIGNVHFNESVAMSHGSGLNVKSQKAGNEYTARIEMQPFGKFQGKGAYSASDLKREQKPKLAVGFTYDYNQNINTSAKVKGKELIDSRYITTMFADLMFKYKGLSIMGEWADKQTDSSPLSMNPDSAATSFYVGSGLNIQAGYLFKNNWEIAARYTAITPLAITEYNNLTEYTLGFSRYVVGHSLKVQGDVTLRQEDSKDDKLYYRLQVEMAF